jgi:hypothetical protein
MPMFVNGANSPFPTGTNPVSIATADLNGDGHLDLLTTNYISDNVSVLFGNGHGVFTPQPAVPVGNGPREVEAGGLDGDGDIDFVTSNYAANSISVLRNNGNGTFAAAVDVPTGGLVARSVALADLDGDGDLDAVTANYNSNNVSVLLNNGSGGRNPSGARRAGGFQRRPPARHCGHQQQLQHRLDPAQQRFGRLYGRRVPGHRRRPARHGGG